MSEDASNYGLIQKIREYYKILEVPSTNKGYDILNVPDELLSWLISVLHNSPIPAPGTDLPWNNLISALHNHRITGLFSYRLRNLPEIYLPPEPWAKSLMTSHIQGLSWFRTIAQISHLDRLFRGAETQYILLKGPALGWQVYPHPSIRESIDIDILIGKEDVDKMTAILCDNGYTIRFNSKEASDQVFHHQVFFPGPKTGTKTVELHWRPLYLPKATGGITVQDLMERKSFIQTEIGQIPALTLPDALMYAVTHMWIGHPDELRLIWIADIEYLMIHITRLDLLKHVEQAACEWHGLESLKRGCDVASLWMGTKTNLFQEGWPQPTPDEADIFIYVDKKLSGKGLNLYEQIRQMPNFRAKMKALMYCCSASSKILTSHSNESMTVKVSAWWKVWKSVNVDRNDSLYHCFLTWCSWITALIRVCFKKTK